MHFERKTYNNAYKLYEGELAACARAYNSAVSIATERLYSVVLSSDSDAIWALILAYLTGGERSVYVQRSSTAKGMRPTNINISTLVHCIGDMRLSSSGTEQWGGGEEIVPADRIIIILVLVALTGCHDFFPGLITVGFKSALNKVSEFFEVFKNNDLRLGKLVEIKFIEQPGTVSLINSSNLATESTLTHSIHFLLCR